MKKIISVLLLVVLSLSAAADSPKLASEKIFDDIDFYDTSLTIMIVEKKDKTVKSVSFKNNPELLKKIKKAVSSDRSAADSKTLSSCNGEISEYLDIITDEATVKIGFNQSKSRDTYFFVKTTPSKNYQRNASGNNVRKTGSPSKKTKQTKKTRQTKSVSNSNSRSSADFDDFLDEDWYPFLQTNN